MDDVRRFGGPSLIEIDQDIKLRSIALEGRVKAYSHKAGRLEAEFTADDTSSYWRTLEITIDLRWDPNQPPGPR